MEKKETENKRYICLARASDTADGTTSTEAQLAMLKEYGTRMGMVFVDQIVLDGVTGSRPGKRKDLTDLLARKREKNDFDIVLLQRLDRLTRGGSAHGFWFEHECTCVGLRLQFVGDDIPDGRYANLIKVAKYEAAQEQAFSISQRSTQGAQLALEEGRNATSAHTPYGCWRLYLTADSKPSHIIADLRDGRQQKLDPHSHAIIDTYGHLGGGSKGHYRKQKNEKVLLIPGAAAEIAIVREIFELHFRQGMGGKRIADVLNRRGVLSSQGKQWSQHQVEVIYEQEVYTGRSVGNRTSSAIYHERSKSAPTRIELDREVQATAKNIPVRQRPREEWFVQEQPMMKTFLDADLRQLAMAEHERL
jgi:DNA invertase Pin-like site-specific DNA recombinase